MEAIGELTDRRGVGGITLFCPDTYGSESDFHCRFFHPRVGADEDVASGTSLGACAAYIVEQRLVPVADQITVVTEQGHSMGRPTKAEIRVNAVGGRIQTIELVATGAVVMRGSFHFNRRVIVAAY
jgi:PhzF family phenazine biosynthesis protein